VPYINKQALVAGSTERLVKRTHVILNMVVLSASNEPLRLLPAWMRTRLTPPKRCHEPVGRPNVVALGPECSKQFRPPFRLHPDTDDPAICGIAASTNLYQIDSQWALREKTGYPLPQETRHRRHDDRSQQERYRGGVFTALYGCAPDTGVPVLARQGGRPHPAEPGRHRPDRNPQAAARRDAG
jgi:hypothetical protein